MTETIKFPLFVDTHVHFREPSSNEAETIASGSEAALHGGYGYVFDMPNNPGEPTHTLERVIQKLKIAERDSRVLFGAYAGWQPGNGQEPSVLARMAPFVMAKKDYLTKTTGNDRELEVGDFMAGIKVFHDAAPEKPNMIHPGNTDHVEQYIKDVAKRLGHHVHVCHVNDPAVAELVAKHRDAGLPVSSGVTPHHLVKTSHDVHTHGKFAEMMPPLADQVDTEKLLWQLDQGIIDTVETDHAPHSYEAKMNAELKGGDCFGVPGIELAFPILWYQVQRGRLSQERLIEVLSTRPAEIMGVKIPEGSYSEWTPHTYRLESEAEITHSKSGWTPYLGQMVIGHLVRVVFDGKTLYDENMPSETVRPLLAHDQQPVITERAV